MTSLPQGTQLLVLAVALLSILMLALGSCCLHLLPAWRRSREAEESAKMLLRDLLSPGEQQQLARFGYLVVGSPSVANREYRIPAAGGYVHGYESGKAVMKICLQPVERLPAPNVLLIHKLMIEGDEEGYLHQANIQRLHARSGRGHNTVTDPLLPEAGWTRGFRL